ncbi:MAG: FecR family protein [Bacteroidales bacterium]|nr:FecR family protein [Bacteroidales bacterium]
MGLGSDTEIEILLEKYFVKNCTKEEKQRLFEILSSPENEKSIKEILYSHLDEYSFDSDIQQDIDSERIYNQIMTDLQLPKTREPESLLLRRRTRMRQIFIQGLSVAAVFCIAFFLGSIFNQSDNENADKHIISTTFNEIKAPLGSKSEIKLADGTIVILNAGSLLKYKPDFNMNNRDLFLEGEAYFKVAKNTNLPLIVSAGNINIKATGTEFNVKAYNDENIVETTLVEGKVEISQKGVTDEKRMLELKPDQKAIYVRESDKMTLGEINEIEPLAVKPAKIATENLLVSPKADIDQVIAWTQDKMIIRGENLENLCVKLQRKYDVTFVFGNEDIKKCRFSGILLDETLEQVLNVIKLTAPVDYLLDGKIVLMISNKEKIEKYSKHMKK